MKIAIGKHEALFNNNNCTFKLHKEANATEILALIEAAIQHFKSNNQDSSLELNLLLTRKMHQIIREGTYLQKIRYIQLVGPKDEILRQEQFRDIEHFFKFNKILSKTGIINYFASNQESKRIIAVHPQYVEYDEEIREGLKVMARKHWKDYPMFVESESALESALKTCMPYSTLVIDGHWVHDKRSKYGVWDENDAEYMSDQITSCITSNPGKISHINLLGCESGKIKNELKANIFPENLYFKYDAKPNSRTREMGNQRNRAIYVSEKQESIFDTKSLAFLLIKKLSDKNIAVTATPKMLYPWPPEDPVMNIGSDTQEWKNPQQCWNIAEITDQLQLLVGQLKSITQITNNEQFAANTKKPWIYRKKPM